MNWNPFNRNKGGSTQTDTAEYYANAGSEGATSIDWNLAAPRIAGVILMVILIAAGGIILFGGSDEKKPAGTDKKPATQQEQRARQPENRNTQSNSPTPSANGGTGQTGGGQTSPPTASGSQGATAPASGTQQLADSGPGEVMGVFVAATLGGALTYHFALRRRLA